MNQKLQDKAWLILRLAFGLGLAGFHGYFKLFGGKMDGFIETVGGKVGLPFPAFFAWSAALVEFAGGLLIALGLFTRPAAALGALVMMGALVRHRVDPFARWELALLYLAVMVAFVMVGGGRYSLDRALKIRPPLG